MITQPTILILVGITGDLSKRKLLPAIEGLRQKGILPEQFRLVGVTRREDPELFKMDLDNIDDYKKLKDHLQGIEKEWGVPAQRLFYLSVAPTISMPIIALLGKAGLANVENTKLLLEKPFGTDLENGQQLIDDIATHFFDEQVYRIDHYLQKDSVRSLSEKAFDMKNVERINVFASEKIGIEGRGDFYEQTGALRDFVQSHLLEVAAMIVAPENRLEALKGFFIPNPVLSFVKRGQYVGYKEAVEDQNSTVETFVSVKMQSNDFPGISILLKTGKMLDRKSTDIHILYKDGASEAISLNDAHNAYEHVFEDAMSGNKAFFVSKEEVLENWRIINPIQEAWEKGNDDLIMYEQGTPM